MPWAIAHQAPLSMGIIQARILERVAMPSSRGFPLPRDWTQVSYTAGIWATREAQGYWSGQPIPSLGKLPNIGIEPGSPALEVDSLPAELSEKPNLSHFAVQQKLTQHCKWTLLQLIFKKSILITEIFFGVPLKFCPWGKCLSLPHLSLGLTLR